MSGKRRIGHGIDKARDTISSCTNTSCRGRGLARPVGGSSTLPSVPSPHALVPSVGGGWGVCCRGGCWVVGGWGVGGGRGGRAVRGQASSLLGALRLSSRGSGHGLCEPVGLGWGWRRPRAHGPRADGAGGGASGGPARAVVRSSARPRPRGGGGGRGPSTGVGGGPAKEHGGGGGAGSQQIGLCRHGGVEWGGLGFLGGGGGGGWGGWRGCVRGSRPALFFSSSCLLELGH